MTTAKKTKRKPLEMNSRQKQFATNYASGMTQVQAYILAGYSDVEARSNAATLFSTNKSVRDYYNRIIKRKEDLQLAKLTEIVMGPHEVKARLSELARANLVDFLDKDGKPRLSRDIPHHSAAKKYYRKTRTDRNGNPVETSEIALVDQVEALRELAKIHGMYAPSRHLVAGKHRVVIEYAKKPIVEEEEGTITAGTGANNGEREESDA